MAGHRQADTISFENWRVQIRAALLQRSNQSRRVYAISRDARKAADPVINVGKGTEKSEELGITAGKR
jgi:hypothetical protein